VPLVQEAKSRINGSDTHLRGRGVAILADLAPRLRLAFDALISCLSGPSQLSSIEKCSAAATVIAIQPDCQIALRMLRDSLSSDDPLEVHCAYELLRPVISSSPEPTEPAPAPAPAPAAAVAGAPETVSPNRIGLLAVLSDIAGDPRNPGKHYAVELLLTLTGSDALAAQYLADNDENTRRFVLRSARRLNWVVVTESAVFQKYLAEGESGFAAACIDSVPPYGYRECSALLMALRHPAPGIRAHALDVLNFQVERFEDLARPFERNQDQAPAPSEPKSSEAGKFNKALATHVTRLASDPAPEVRAAAIALCGRASSNAIRGELDQCLVEGLDDPTGEVRLAVLQVLLEAAPRLIGQEQTPHIANKCNSRNPNSSFILRATEAAVLGQLRSADFPSLLAELIHGNRLDDDSIGVLVGAMAPESISSDNAVPLLLEIESQPIRPRAKAALLSPLMRFAVQSESARHAALRLLGSLSLRDIPPGWHNSMSSPMGADELQRLDASLLRDIESMIGGSDANVAIVALRALVRLPWNICTYNRGSNIIELAVPALLHSDRRVRMAALDALADIFVMRCAAPAPSGWRAPPSIWPPPPTTLMAVLGDRFFGHMPAHLGSIHEALRQRLIKAGFLDTVVFSIGSDGFALLTRVERVSGIESYRDPSYRFRLAKVPLREVTLTAWLQYLFSEPPGQYRMFMFTVTARQFDEYGAPISPMQSNALHSLPGAESELPDYLAELPAGKARCQVFIYMWRKESEKKFRQLDSGDVGQAWDQLSGAGLVPAKERQ